MEKREQCVRLREQYVQVFGGLETLDLFLEQRGFLYDDNIRYLSDKSKRRMGNEFDKLGQGQDVKDFVGFGICSCFVSYRWFFEGFKSSSE